MKLNSIKLNKRPIIYGEVLFDTFPDGLSVIGGAPFNVAWHLKGFGLNPFFISRVGRDKQGDRLIEIMKQWGMDISGVQIDSDYPTGVVEVKLDNNGKPLFNISSNQAYDYIDFNIIKSYLKDQFSLIYHGSLITREKVSHGSLHNLIYYTRLPCFVDINLRAPWWNRFCIEEIVTSSNWLKLSDEELSIITEGLKTDNIKERANYLYSKYNLESLIVTLGEKGSFVVNEHGITESSITMVSDIVDTVGAGDAFSSVMILGLIKNWPLSLILKRASYFASVICGVKGAITYDRFLYPTILEKGID